MVDIGRYESGTPVRGRRRSATPRGAGGSSFLFGGADPLPDARRHAHPGRAAAAAVGAAGTPRADTRNRSTGRRRATTPTAHHATGGAGLWFGRTSDTHAAPHACAAHYDHDTRPNPQTLRQQQQREALANRAEVNERQYALRREYDARRREAQCAGTGQDSHMPSRRGRSAPGTRGRPQEAVQAQGECRPQQAFWFGTVPDRPKSPGATPGRAGAGSALRQLDTNTHGVGVAAAPRAKVCLRAGAGEDAFDRVKLAELHEMQAVDRASATKIHRRFYPEHPAMRSAPGPAHPDYAKCAPARSTGVAGRPACHPQELRAPYGTAQDVARGHTTHAYIPHYPNEASRTPRAGPQQADRSRQMQRLGEALTSLKSGLQRSQML